MSDTNDKVLIEVAKAQEAKEQAELKKIEEEKKEAQSYAKSYVNAEKYWYYYNATDDGKNATINTSSIICPKTDKSANGSDEKKVDGYIGGVKENFIKMYNREKTTAPILIGEKNFSNQAGVLSTFINISFLGEEGNWNIINTKNSNYIVSLETDDEGAGQKITINLIDKDFNELDKYINTAIKQGQKSTNDDDPDPKQILTSASITNDGKKMTEEEYKSLRELRFNPTYDGDYAKTLIDDYNAALIAMESDPANKDPTHRKMLGDEIKKQYEDAMQNSRTNIDYISICDAGNGDDKEAIVPNLKVKFGYSDENYEGEDWNGGNEYKDYISSKDSNARWNSYKSENTIVDLNDNVDRANNLTFEYINQTKLDSPEYKFYITGVKSNVTQSGISYEISAMSVPRIELSRFRMVARNAIYKGTPKKILYTLFNMFNSNPDSDIKLLWIDKRKIREENVAGEKVDVSECVQHIEDGNATGVDALKITEKSIKKISIHLGNSYDENNGVWDPTKNEYKRGDALPNAESSKRKRLRTISMASVFDEICAQCPPYKNDAEAVNSDIIVKNADGDETKVKSTVGSAVNRMAWRSIGKIKSNGKEYYLVGFYYNEPSYYKYVRVYNWGPAAKSTVVKSLSVESENEFALLSVQKTIGKDSKVTVGDGYSREITFGTSDLFKNGFEGTYNFYSVADQDCVKNAYAQCNYKGEMQIVGDPGYAFGNVLTPYSYPIYISVDVLKNNGTENALAQHYSSGYYVVTNIKHSISTSGYTTTLGIMSYPGLIKQIYDGPPCSTKKK